ncbi:MAG: dienelactone hydrolase family protein [Solirubrobacteraceae bacterium]
MCFDYDALPPDLPADLRIPALAGGAAAELLTITSADGAEFGAALAQTPAASGPAVVILPDVRGLYRFYVELAERFAAAGHNAIAIDYFGRTAGTGERDGEFDYMAHLPDTSPAQVQADVAAAIELLRSRTDSTSFVTVGFCYGGSQSFLAGGNEGLGLDGVVGFYGTLDPGRIGMPFDMPAPLPAVAETRVPVLGLFGGADDFIPAEDIRAFDDGLEVAGVEHELVTYEGAPHSFFDRSYEEHAEASEDAWRRVLGFLAR